MAHKYIKYINIS